MYYYTYIYIYIYIYIERERDILVLLLVFACLEKEPADCTLSVVSEASEIFCDSDTSFIR